MRQFTPSIIMTSLSNKIKKHQDRLRRDVVSKASMTCTYCDFKGRFRDIRSHLRKIHNLYSYVQCKQKTCNFFCAQSFKCFKTHSARVHQEFFNGRSTNLGDGKYFKLIKMGNKIKENIHSRNCKHETEVGGKKKKKEIRLRNAAEKISYRGYIRLRLFFLFVFIY